MGLEVLLGGGHKLDGDELEAVELVRAFDRLFRDSDGLDFGLPTVLEAGDDGTNEATLQDDDVSISSL